MYRAIYDSHFMERVNVSCTVMQDQQDHTLNLPQILNYTLLGAPVLDV